MSDKGLQSEEHHPDNELSQILFHFNEGYEEYTIRQSLANLEAAVLPDQKAGYEEVDKDTRQTLAVIAHLTDDELNILKTNHSRITSTTGLHDLPGHLNTLHGLTGNKRYLN